MYPAIVSVLFLSRYALLGQPRLNRQLYPLMLGVLFVFSAFRYQVGCDWSGYYIHYTIAGQRSLERIVEVRDPVWWTILWLQHQLELPYPWINVFSSAIFFAGVHVLARRQPDPLGFLVLLFPVLIINMPMSGIRQGAAIGLICIAMTRFLDGRTIAFGIWVFLAALLHSSAAIFMLLLPLVAQRITKWRVLAMIVLAIPGALLLIGSEAGQVAGSRYIDRDISSGGAVFRVSLLFITGLFYLVFLRRVWRKSSPEDYSFINVGVAGMLLMGVLLPVSSVVADRVAYYLIPWQTMILARIPYLAGLPNRGLLAALPYLGLLVFFTGWAVQSWHFNQCYVPYQTWIFGLPDFY